MARSRSVMIRDYAWGLRKAYGCEFSTAFIDKSRWDLRWEDGPTVETVRDSVARNLPDHVTVVVPIREYSSRAVVLGAIRAFSTGAIDEYRGTELWTIRSCGEALLRDVADPVVGATERERAMVERLLEPSARTDVWGRRVLDEEDALGRLAERRGIGWLLGPSSTAVDSDRQALPDGAVPALASTPIEALTARYARGAQREAWNRSGAPMATADAFASALEDDELDEDGALAALALVAALRAELDAQEVRLIDTARSSGASWTDVGAVLGMTKQSAAERRAVLARRSLREPQL